MKLYFKRRDVKWVKKKVDNVNVMDENNETEVEVTVVKTKWSLKKKLMIGGGIFAGLVLGGNCPWK